MVAGAGAQLVRHTDTPTNVAQPRVPATGICARAKGVSLDVLHRHGAARRSFRRTVDRYCFALLRLRLSRCDRGRRQRGLFSKATTERQIQIDPIHMLLRLHAQQCSCAPSKASSPAAGRCAGRCCRRAEAGLSSDSAVFVPCCAAADQKGLAIAQYRLGRKRAFDFTEGANPDLRPLSGCLFLFGLARFDLRCECTRHEEQGAVMFAPKPTSGLLRSLSTKTSLEMDETPAVRARRGRRAASASPTRLKAASTRRCAAITSGRRSSNSDGSPAGGEGGSAAKTAGALISSVAG